MRNNNRGFIAISVIYSFFVIFLMLMLIILNSYFNNRTSFDIFKENIKVKAALGYTYASSNTLYLTDAVRKQVDLTKTLPSGVISDGSSYGSYRYVGKTPNNYICFGRLDGNCSDEKYLFRIVGIFKESNVSAAGGSGYVTKIVRAKPLSSTRAYNSTSSNNKWSSSSLNTYLNNTYINSLTDANFETLYKDKMIIEAKWHAPAQANLSLYAKEAYTAQMGATGDYLSTGKIGLLSVSDWGYASKTMGSCDISRHTMDKYNSGLTNTCYLYNWLNSDLWFIDSYTTSTYALTLSAGTNKYNLTQGNVASARKAVYPTFYLHSKVVVMSGSGSKVDPYLINLLEV